MKWLTLGNYRLNTEHVVALEGDIENGVIVQLQGGHSFRCKGDYAAAALAWLQSEMNPQPKPQEKK